MNLKLLYPQPLRLLVRDSFSWVTLAVVQLTLIWSLSEGWVGAWGFGAEQLVVKKIIFLAAVVGVISVRFCYTFLYRAAYRYEITRGRLRIVRGVLLKEEALLPLMPMTEIYIRRNWLDLLFGLANIHVAVALERAAKIGEIRGLRLRDAHRLREHILDLIEAPLRSSESHAPHKHLTTTPQQQMLPHHAPLLEIHSLEIPKILEGLRPPRCESSLNS